jgi:GT2 family glycosyltransferase
MIILAILITCFNRKDKTLECFKRIASQNNGSLFEWDVFLVDDGTDGTGETIKKKYANANVSIGTGSLYWAGGMRVAWDKAISSNRNYDFYLLLNDDTLLVQGAIQNLLKDYAVLNNDAIIVGTTKDVRTNRISYGGSRLKNRYNLKSETVVPNNSFPQLCDLGNANVMLVPNLICKKIGTLSQSFTHGIADFDYTLKARKAGFHVYVASTILGECVNDHGNSWKSFRSTNLKQRVEFLYSVKGLAYKEYLVFIKSHFPLYLPEVFLKLWLKTFLPFLWQKYKR